MRLLFPIGDSAWSALKAVAENTCFVSVSATLIGLSERGLIISVAATEKHCCGWMVTTAGEWLLEVAREVPEDDDYTSTVSNGGAGSASL